MAQKQQISIIKDRAKYRCPQNLKRLIDYVNYIDERAEDKEDWESFEKLDPELASGSKNLCKAVHEIAQIASLAVDMRMDYANAAIGTTEEWERFCQRLPCRLWRKWPEAVWRQWPQIRIDLMIGTDGRINSKENEYELQTALIGVEARRLKECRHCQRIFWATRIDMVGCSKRCSNNLRGRTFREKPDRPKKRKKC